MTYSIVSTPLTVGEGDGTLTFTVTRSSATKAETVYVSTAPILGYSNNNDYVGLLNKALTFDVGQLETTVTINILNDYLQEADETFGIVVQQKASDPVSTYLAWGEFTIIDDDAPSPPPKPVKFTTYPAQGYNQIGQGNMDNDDSHAPGTERQWAYDFLVPVGTDVRAVSDGVVVAVQDDLSGAFRGYGNTITLLTSDGVYVTYGHLKAFSASVTVNQQVTAGTVMAQSGDSGTYQNGSLHPNLHIQLGTQASIMDGEFGNGSTAILMADGENDAVAPAYFPRLVIRFDHRDDPGLSTDTDYYGTYGVDVFVGNAYGNTVFGDRGNDILRGKDGDDHLQGGRGADRLAGGRGNDHFVYMDPSEGRDTITDFRHHHDTFDFSGVAFANLDPGTLDPVHFHRGVTNAAADADDFFIFRTTDRTLWFDPDGTGAHAAVLIADMQDTARLTYDDIHII